MPNQSEESRAPKQGPDHLDDADLPTPDEAQAPDDDSQWAELIDPEDIPGIYSALTRYRVMAWIVGILLVVLVVVGVPLKYLAGYGAVVTWTGIPHGWLYMILLITAYDLSRRVKWSLWWILAIMAAGTIPFLSFVAEHFATRDVRRRIAVVENRSVAT